MGQVEEAAQEASTYTGAVTPLGRLMSLRPRRFDLFVVSSLSFFVVIRVAQDAEFTFYMFVMAAILIALWSRLRRFELTTGVLIAMIIGLVAHYAGGLIVYGPESVRLYGHYFGGVRFDKIVHAYNSGVLVFFAWRPMQQAGIRLDGGRLWILPMIALGAGAVWEIIEYAAVASVVVTGVGDYVNNAQDLVANMFGALVAVSVLAARKTIKPVGTASASRTLREETRVRT